MGNKMDENEVIKKLVTHLKNQGWEIINFVPAGERGIDVEVKDQSGQLWYIEAKGGTSSNPRSNRYGLPYTRSQVFDVTSKGLMQCFHHLANHKDIKIGFVYPDGHHFRDYMNPIKPMLSSIGLNLFCVLENGAVKEN
jgi:hypothetical protein